MPLQQHGTTKTGHTIWVGSLSEMNAAVRPALEQCQVIGGDLYESNGTSWNQISSGGKALTINGIAVKAVHRREINALVGTAQTLDWSGTPIHGVILMAVQEAVGTAELRASVAYCLDPPSDAVRDTWLTAGSSLLTDTERDVFPVNFEEEVFFGGSTITKIGVKREFGSENLRLIALGLEGY